MNIVTGATGFLGSHVVCQLLQSNQVVRAFRRPTASLQEFDTVFNWYFTNESQQNIAHKNLHWVSADVLDVDSIAEALIGAENVFHCAALVSFEPTDRDAMMKVNVEGTANMVNLSLLQGIKKFCHVSSIASLGRKKSGEFMDEKTHWEESKLNSNYAISKYKAELEVWRAAEEGLPVVIVNPGVIIGVGDFHKGSNHLIHSVFNGMPLYSTGVNGYVNVVDVAKAMCELVAKQIVHERFVLVGYNLSIKDLFFALADQFHIKRASIEVKPWMAGLSWRIMWLIKPFYNKGISITKETARAAINHSYYRSDKIMNALPITFTPFEKTIQQCCESYLVQHK